MCSTRLYMESHQQKSFFKYKFNVTLDNKSYWYEGKLIHNLCLKSIHINMAARLWPTTNQPTMVWLREFISRLQDFAKTSDILIEWYMYFVRLMISVQKKNSGEQYRMSLMLFNFFNFFSFDIQSFFVAQVTFFQI